jgi:Rad3-related DNA helicase
MEIIDKILFNNINENIDTWTSNYLRRFEFRQYQKEYIANIIYSIIANDKHVNIVEAPTGSGKSIIVLITAGVLSTYYNKKSYILCSDLYLWEQYSKAIDKFNLFKFGRIKGILNNYNCDETGEDLSLAPCRLAGIPYRTLFNKEWCYVNEWECATYCSYIRERKRAIESDVTLMTYQLYFPCMYEVEAMKDIFPPRDVVFCDECHNIPDLCQQFSTIILDEHNDLDKFQSFIDYCLEEGDLIKDPTKDEKYFKIFFTDFRELYHNIQKDSDNIGNDYYLHFLKKFHTQLSLLNIISSAVLDIFNKASEEARARKSYLSKREFKALENAKWICKFWSCIDEYINFSKGYIECIIKSDNRIYNNDTGRLEWPTNPQVYFKFAKEDILVYNDLLKYQPYTVMLSATVGDKLSFEDNIGIKFMEDKESEMFIIPSTFDFSKSPIYFIPGNRMSRDYINKSFPINAKIINSILKSPKHINEKGIIHTGSYKNAHDLLKFLDKECQNRIFIYNDSKEKKEILSKFANSKNGVLIGPTLTEGIDFPDDGCRFIIILKVPYPYLGDNLVKAKCSLFPRWYNSETSSAIIQGIGRGNRHINDWSTTYILDGSFENLYLETRNQYPKELLERMQVLTHKKGS